MGSNHFPVISSGPGFKLGFSIKKLNPNDKFFESGLLFLSYWNCCTWNKYSLGEENGQGFILQIVRRERSFFIPVMVAPISHAKQNSFHRKAHVFAGLFLCSGTLKDTFYVHILNEAKGRFEHWLHILWKIILTSKIYASSGLWVIQNLPHKCSPSLSVCFRKTR